MSIPPTTILPNPGNTLRLFLTSSWQGIRHCSPLVPPPLTWPLSSFFPCSCSFLPSLQVPLCSSNCRAFHQNHFSCRHWFQLPDINLPLPFLSWTPDSQIHLLTGHICLDPPETLQKDNVQKELTIFSLACQSASVGPSLLVAPPPPYLHWINHQRLINHF